MSFKKLSGVVLGVLFLTACTKAPATSPTAPTPSEKPLSTGELPQVNLADVGKQAEEFGQGVKYEAKDVNVSKDLAADFSMDEVKNVKDMETAYGFTFSSAELNFLAKNKFVIKNLLDTNIHPNSGDNNLREFVELYKRLTGPYNWRDRTQANAVYFSSDVFFNTYNNLFTELLKEMENTVFYPAVRDFTERFYKTADKKLAEATSDMDKNKWLKVRNYFAVAYAIFANAAKPLSQDSYIGPGGEMLNPATVMADFKVSDAKVDTFAKVSAFAKGLKLDADSEKAVLADLKSIYDAGGPGVPAVFQKEYDAYSKQENIEFKVDFSQFTPRSHYTSSSLRRQYFRGMKWYIMVPFFVKSADLTTYSFAISQLMSEDSQALADYSRIEAAINFMVGGSDDLMPIDYLLALKSAKGAADPSAAAMDYLVKAHNPKIKDLSATYQSVGTEQTDDVRLKTKGMRFFSGKFIIDSYWTGYLTQGDEAPRPGYTQKLPPMASSLEVMTLLGSDYAKTQIPKLDFYSDKNSKAIEQALGELSAENSKLTDADWQKNLYMGWLWTINGLFDWQKANHDLLPSFMQSPLWDAKTLMTASAFWTELRHATLLYAKQSFAEKGGGGPNACDSRHPDPAKGYIEPDWGAYQRLYYLAERTNQGLKDAGYQLKNMGPLDTFTQLMAQVKDYTEKELKNTEYKEPMTSETGPDPEDSSKSCTTYTIPDDSDWEVLRIKLVQELDGSIPVPTEGPILPAKDRRAALIADVHTGGDSSYDTRILYEGTGVPYVIFTAVKDANGARLTVGFTYSQYEFTHLLDGPRMTDEEWQKKFYQGDDPYSAFNYTDKSTWPKENVWYQPLFDLK